MCIRDRPIAFNMNLILTDKAGNAALYETLDGRKAFRTIDPSSDAQYLYATNHPLLEELIPHEPRAMENSLKRIRNIEAFLEQHGKGLGTEDLKQFLLTPYPAGLSCPCLLYTSPASQGAGLFQAPMLLTRCRP